MEVRSVLLKSFHLDPSFSLMTVRSAVLSMELFNLLDIHGTSAINGESLRNVYTEGWCLK